MTGGLFSAQEARSAQNERAAANNSNQVSSYGDLAKSFDKLFVEHASSAPDLPEHNDVWFGTVAVSECPRLGREATIETRLNQRQLSYEDLDRSNDRFWGGGC